MPDSISLIEMLNLLRNATTAQRAAIQLYPYPLRDAYLALARNAPTRAQGYLSATRAGLPTGSDPSTRREEHLAMALCNHGEIAFSDGEKLKLLDYQFPLKPTNTDKGIGKIDILGLSADGVLTVVELKSSASREDRRIGLIESLTYAAIVEGNIERISKEIEALHHCDVARKRPRIAIVAPSGFWFEPRAKESTKDLDSLVERVSKALNIQIDTFMLLNVELEQMGSADAAPTVRGIALLKKREPATFSSPMQSVRTSAPAN